MAWPKPSPVPNWIAARIGGNATLEVMQIPCYKCKKQFEVFIANIQKIGYRENFTNIYSTTYPIRVQQPSAELHSEIALIPSCKEHAKGYDLVLCSLGMLSDETEAKFDEKTAFSIVDGTYRSIRLKD